MDIYFDYGFIKTFESNLNLYKIEYHRKYALTFAIIVLLWLEIICWMFGRQLYETFIVDLLKIFESGVFLKCLSIRCRNFAAMLVFTLALKGGLNHVTFLDLLRFSFVSGVLSLYSSLFLYPALASAFS